MAKSRFDGLKKAQVFEQGQHMAPGFDGVVRLDAVKEVQSQNGKGLLIITEFTVVENGTDDDPNGAHRCYIVRYDDGPGPGNVLALLAAASGNDPKDDEFLDAAPGMLEEAVGPEQPLADTTLQLRTILVDTKPSPKNGMKPGKYTKHVWRPIES